MPMVMRFILSIETGRSWGAFLTAGRVPERRATQRGFGGSPMNPVGHNRLTGMPQREKLRWSHPERDGMRGRCSRTPDPCVTSTQSPEGRLRSSRLPARCVTPRAICRHCPVSFRTVRYRRAQRGPIGCSALPLKHIFERCPIQFVQFPTFARVRALTFFYVNFDATALCRCY